MNAKQLLTIVVAISTGACGNRDDAAEKRALSGPVDAVSSTPEPGDLSNETKEAADPSVGPAVNPNTPSMRERAETDRFDPTDKSIPELQAAMADGRLDAVRLVEFYLDRIDAYDQRGPKIRAMISVAPRKEALALAHALDEERAAKGPRGPLHGIPVVVKDVIDVAGFATSGGTKLLEASRPSQDATVAARLRSAGAVLLGKANLDELQIGAFGLSTLGGQTLNPFDLGRIAGGSSGGSGAAVAANFAALAIGADTNGSIRTPSAYNGIFGLRTTRGLVSRTGSMPGAELLDVLGPMAKSPMDLAIALDALAGHDANDPATEASKGRIPSAGYAARLDASSLKGRRIGYVAEFMTFLDAKSAASMQAAMDRFKVAGAELVPMVISGSDPLFKKIDELQGLSGVGSVSARWETYFSGMSQSPVASLQELVDEGRSTLFGNQAPADKLLRFGALQAKLNAPSGNDGPRPADKQAELRAAFHSRLDADRVDALILASFGEANRILPDGVELPGLPVKPTFPVDALAIAMSSTAGLPTLVIPAGFGPSGAPIAMQLVGREFADGDLLAFGFAIERHMPARRLPKHTPALSD